MTLSYREESGPVSVVYERPKLAQDLLPLCLRESAQLLGQLDHARACLLRRHLALPVFNGRAQVQEAVLQREPGIGKASPRAEMLDTFGLEREEVLHLGRAHDFDLVAAMRTSDEHLTRPLFRYCLGYSGYTVELNPTGRKQAMRYIVLVTIASFVLALVAAGSSVSVID